MINAESLQTAAAADIEFFSMKEHALKLEAQGYQFGTVEITIGRETRRVPCMVCKGLVETYGWMTGITGRYLTGTKAWPCTISQQMVQRCRVAPRCAWLTPKGCKHRVSAWRRAIARFALFSIQSASSTWITSLLILGDSYPKLEGCDETGYS